MSVLIRCALVCVCVCARVHPAQVFVCAELTHCRYHPESVQYPGMASEKGWHGTGLYPCCSQRVLRFDPSGLPKVEAAKPRLWASERVGGRLGRDREQTCVCVCVCVCVSAVCWKLSEPWSASNMQSLRALASEDLSL